VLTCLKLMHIFAIEIQNADILVPANPSPHGKMAVKVESERERERQREREREVQIQIQRVAMEKM